ncbi:hypothetical protein D3C81_2132550 [compost metagenome]
MLRRVSIAIECKVLVIKVEERVVEVWKVLSPFCGCRIVLIWPFVQVLDAVVEKPVGNQSFLLARHMLAV